MATMDRYTMNRHACSRGELLSCAGSGPPGRRGMLIWAREVEHLPRRWWVRQQDASWQRQAYDFC